MVQSNELLEPNKIVVSLSVRSTFTLMSTSQLREREQRREERYDDDRRRVECPSTIFLHSEHLNNEGYYHEKGGVHASRLSIAAVGYRGGLCLASLTIAMPMSTRQKSESHNTHYDSGSVLI